MSRLSFFYGMVLLAMLAGAGSVRAEDTAAPKAAPKGELRVALIGGDPGLVSRDAEGKLGGVLTEVANALAGHIGVMGKLVLYDNRTHYNLTLDKDEWDVAARPRALS